MGSSTKKGTGRSKKQKGIINLNKWASAKTTPTTPVRARQIAANSSLNIQTPPAIPENDDNFNLIINFQKLKTAFESLTWHCPDDLCNSKKLNLRHNQQKYGLAHCLSICCANCSWENKFWTSPTIAELEPEEDDAAASANSVDVIVAGTEEVDGEDGEDGEYEMSSIFNEVFARELDIENSDNNDDIIPEIENTRKSTSPGQRYNNFDVNLRTVIAFREIGCGYKYIEKFCGLMNLPPPVKERNYQKQVNKLVNAYSNCALKSMQAAAEYAVIQEGQRDIRVSLDGTWQKRGHQSKNGVVTLMSSKTGKCIDYEICTKTCKACQYWTDDRQAENPDDFVAFREKHICDINHSGSAGSMESTGAVNLFNRSVKKYNLRYKEYLGDGDSSAFKQVVDSKPYGGLLVPKKLECCGHVQKRVGTRLRKLRKTKKGISGKGKLTDKAIAILQCAYGMAIKQNLGSVAKMRKSIAGIVWHYSEGNDATRHLYCPNPPDPTWCKFKSNSNHKPKFTLPANIKDSIKPIFQELADPKLLEKCTHGQTQNVNEALNKIVWSRCPKEIFVERKILQIGVASAVMQFNNGYKGLMSVFSRIGIVLGSYTTQYFENAVKKKT